MSARLPELALPVRIRRAGPADRRDVARMLAGMDRDGLYHRHFSHGDAPNAALLKRLDEVDGRDRMVVVAQGPDGRVVGHGEYAPDGSGVEFALMVLPAWRGRGIAGAMLRQLAREARAAGHEEIHGQIQAGNTAMLYLAQAAGFACEASDEPAVLVVRQALQT